MFENKVVRNILGPKRK